MAGAGVDTTEVAMTFNWKSAISGVAPMLGTALKGVFGGLAVSFVTEALGLNEDSKDEQIESAIKRDPEAWVKLKEAEFKFKARMKKLDITEEQLIFKDKDSARKREIALNDKTPLILAIFITFGFFGLVSLIIFYPIPEATKDILQIMIGTLGTAWIGVCTYYFGSSYGSAQKNHIIYNREG